VSSPASGRAPIAGLLTHTYPLAEYRTALETASNKGGGESIKVAFRF
jgi:threonine dehydrogenase-like Zn-dependent dehydrogenase